MKTTILALILAATAAAGALTPETLTLTFDRTSAAAVVTSTPYIESTSITLTNCTALLLAVGTNAPAAQDLTDCGLILYVGNSETSVTYYATAQIATNGTFSATITLPAITAATGTGYTSTSDTYAGIALAITSGATRIDYRDEKRVYLRQRLH
jgi:hypothetical protein